MALSQPAPENLPLAREDGALVAELKALLGRYPRPRGGLLPILHRLQARRSFLDDDDLRLAAELTGLSAAEVLSVSSFYTMFRRQRPGRVPLGLCRNISCWLCGSEQLKALIHEELGIGPGQTTPDGAFSFEEVECLGSCGTAPVLEVHGHNFESLSPQQLRRMIQDWKSGREPAAPAPSEGVAR